MIRWQIFLLALFIGSPLVSQAAIPSAATCIAPPAENLQLDTSAGYAEAIQNYLSAGGDPNRLKPLLQAANLIPSRDITNGLYVLDLNGDTKDDVIVNIAYPITQPDAKIFVIWVYICDGNNYRRMYDTSYIQASPALDRGAYVDMVQDVNHDSYPEIILRSVGCGVNTCYENLGIVGWNSEQHEIHQMLNANFLEGHYTFEDKDGDGLYDVVVITGITGSNGDGPQRRWQIVYGWDGINFSQRSSTPEPPHFGFQAVEDAAAALRTGDLQTAAILYQKILDDQFDPIEGQTDAISKSQALFGLLIIRTSQQDYDSADVLYAQLQNFQGIPNDTFATTYSESIWTKVGRTFYQKADHIYDCDAVIAELNAERDDKSNYQSTYWGHFGRPPKPETMCPF